MSIFRKIKKPELKVEMKDRIPLVPKEQVVTKEIVKRGPGAPTILERTIRKINRFNDMVNSFEKKASSCNLDGISKDIIEAEHLTIDIDKYINETIISKRNFAIYNKTLERYKNSINYIEKKCKCKPG